MSTTPPAPASGAGDDGEPTSEAGRFQRAARAGDVDAMVRFGALLTECEPVSTDYFVEGLAWLRAAAAAGHAEGQYLYALALWRYEEPEQAREWLRRAAEQGFAAARAWVEPP